MGLNWEKGLKGLAQGLTLVQRGSEQKTDLLYKQMSEANMMRFRQQESAADREWRSGESALSRESQERMHAETVQSTKELKEATLNMTEAQNEWTRAFQGRQLQQGDTRLEQSGEESEEKRIARLQKALDEEASAAKNPIFSDDPNVNENVDLWLNAEKYRVTLKDGTPAAKRFDTLYEGRKNPRTGQYASIYAKLSDEELAKVNARADELWRNGSDKGAKGKKLAIYQALEEYKETSSVPDIFGMPNNPQTGGGEQPPKNPTPPPEVPLERQDAIDAVAEDKMQDKKTGGLSARSRSQAEARQQVDKPERDREKWIADRAKAIEKKMPLNGRGRFAMQERKRQALAMAENEWAMAHKGQKARNPTDAEAQFAQSQMSQ